MVANPCISNDLVIPVIDFGPYLSGTPDGKQAVGDEIIHALRSSGFLYIKDHGISQDEIDLAYKNSAAFFNRPQAEKDAVEWTTAESNRGYVSIGREKVTLDDVASEDLRNTNPDRKESIGIGRDDEEEYPNLWPKQDEEGKEFKSVTTSFFTACRNLHQNMMRAIALGSKLPETFFDGYVDKGDNLLRLLHYPPIHQSIFRNDTNQVRAGEHTDYGSLTLLFQDSRGGLEVRNKKGDFLPVTPIPGTIVINAGDLLARWANGTIKSTRHRVVEPRGFQSAAANESGVYPSRYSMAYFCNPNADSIIDALPGTFETDADKIYPSIRAGDYLIQRLKGTF